VVTRVAAGVSVAVRVAGLGVGGQTTQQERIGGFGARHALAVEAVHKHALQACTNRPQIG
jgi:hypothetical protein